MAVKKDKCSSTGWGKISLKGRLSEKTSIIFIIFLAFYLIQAIASPFSGISPPLVDLLATTGLMTAAFMLHLRLKLSRAVPLFLGMGLFLHIIGLYRIIPYNIYYTGTLYGAPQLNYHYDWIVHSIGFGLMAIAFCSVVYPYFRAAFKSRMTVFLLLLLAMLGFGALNEMTEFVGYTVFGHGEGFLEFGDGDSSPEQGPWENSSMDLISNLAGGMVFIGLFMVAKKRGGGMRCPS